MHEVAALLNCLLCDSYFIFVVFAFDNLQSLTLKIGGATSNASAKTGKGGGGGKKSSASDKSTLLEDVYAEISECLYRMRYTLQRCPTCVEVICNEKYSAWLDGSTECPLSPCEYLRFDDAEVDVPLYASKNGDQMWTLVHGLAPKGLNFSKTNGARIYKRSFAEFFPRSCSFTYPTPHHKQSGDDDSASSAAADSKRPPPKQQKAQPKPTDIVAPERTSDEHRAIAELVFDALQCTSGLQYYHSIPNELKSMTAEQRQTARDREWKRRFAEEFSLFADLAADSKSNTAAAKPVATATGSGGGDKKSAPPPKSSDAKTNKSKPAVAAATSTAAAASTAATEGLGSILLSSKLSEQRLNTSIVTARTALFERLRTHKPVFAYWDKPLPPPPPAPGGKQPAPKQPAAKQPSTKQSAAAAAGSGGSGGSSGAAAAASGGKVIGLGESLTTFVVTARAELEAAAKKAAADAAADIATASALDK